MQKLKVEFLKKIMNHGIKIDRVNSIRITKLMNLRLFCTVWGFINCDVVIFKLASRA